MPAGRAMHHAQRLGMSFVLWAEQRRTPPPEDVMTRFDVSRATAYRLIRYYREVKGLPLLDRVETRRLNAARRSV